MNQQKKQQQEKLKNTCKLAQILYMI